MGMRGGHGEYILERQKIVAEEPNRYHAINALVWTGAIPLSGVDFWHIFETQVIVALILIAYLVLSL